MKKVLLLGASSDIAEASAYLFAEKGYQLTLAARNVERLIPLSQDLKVKYGNEITLREFQANHFDTHAEFAKSLKDNDLVILYYGYLGEQKKAISNPKEAQEILQTNFLSAVSILSEFANHFEERGDGTILAISSVAGDRGRQSNYFYGSAKAGLTAFLSGLRNRLYPNVHVGTIKPGFVNTKMVEGLPLPAPLTAQPQQVAKSIYQAYQKKKNTVYTLAVWRVIMLIIKNIPEGIFKRMNL